MKYCKEDSNSYAIGMFATMELLNNSPQNIVAIYFSAKLIQTDETKKLFNLCKKLNIKTIERTKLIENIAGKENVFIIGEFKKYNCLLQNDNHLVLVNPSDMGNFGTICRTALGFGIYNIALIKPCVDIFNPKVVRASMGAIFKLNIEFFNTFEEYTNKFMQNTKYMFCLGANNYLQDLKDISTPYSLVFGNEATGLPNEIYNSGKKIKIKQSENIDSFNLAISVALGLYQFTK